ncbi:MAG: dienelactone hydrolase [Bacteroidota bacterium]
MNKHTLSLWTSLIFACFCAFGQVPDDFIYGDLLPDAPELSARGQYAVGVRTLSLVNKGQIDILNYGKEGVDSLYDRPLTVEVWYPASLSAGEDELVIYDEVMGNFGAEDRPLIPFTFKGRASRDAQTNAGDGPYPLVIMSHGYTGSRLMYTYLTENLASKGYVVVAIDHTESTFRDANQFTSTLLNRSLDILFVLNEMARLSAPNAESFLSELVDANNTAIMGYSMGGYGVVNVGGAGYSAGAGLFFSSNAGGSRALEQRIAGNEAHEASMDDRIKAVVALAPWGMARGVWDAKGLAGLRKPTFFIAGSKDDISGYEDGIKAIYEGAVNTDRYLLTYQGARHNVAPNPPPPESLEAGRHLDEYLRYADSVWDQRRINNINQHFITAFLGIHLKETGDYQKFLDEPEGEDEEVWNGFKPRTWVGLELLHATPE